MSVRRLVRIALTLSLALLALESPSLAKPAGNVPIREEYALSPDGVRIYYRIAGSGPETVIAPFALFHGSALDRLAKGRRIVTYDPRGRGKSDPAPLDRVSLDFLLSDLETVRRAVGAEKSRSSAGRVRAWKASSTRCATPGE